MIYNSENQETTQTYIKRENWGRKVYLYIENQYGNENKLIIICNNMDESHIEWKKPNIKDYYKY